LPPRVAARGFDGTKPSTFEKWHFIQGLYINTLYQDSNLVEIFFLEGIPMLRKTIVLSMAVCIWWSGLAGATPDFKPTAKTITEKWQKAVITVRVVIRLKQTIMGQTRDQEQKLEVGGTVIDSSGLTVTSASALDPTMLFRMLSGGMGNQFRMESEVKETTLIQADGTEVEADIVLKDSNLDMAFIQPREASQPFEFIPLKPVGRQLQILDSVLVVARLGKVGNRAIMASVGDINAFVKGPRSFYVCDESLGSAVGNLAYNEEGLPVGIFLTKQTQESVEGGAGLARRRSSDLTMTVLRPVEDLIEIAEQARTLKPAESKQQ